MAKEDMWVESSMKKEIKSEKLQKVRKFREFGFALRESQWKILIREWWAPYFKVMLAAVLRIDWKKNRRKMKGGMEKRETKVS